MSSKSCKVEVIYKPVVSDEIWIGRDRVVVYLKISQPVWTSEIGDACKQFETILRDQLPLKQMPSGAHVPVGENHLHVYTTRQTSVTGKELERALKQFEEFLVECLERHPDKGVLDQPFAE